MAVQASNLAAGKALYCVQRMLWLQPQIRMLAAVNCHHPLEGGPDAGKLRCHVGKPLGGPIEIDDQALHVPPATFLRNFCFHETGTAVQRESSSTDDVVIC